MTEDSLSPASRRAALAALRAEPPDILVVGGGITGAGVALDAASRGLKVGLIEKGDFASGTSSKSSKMIHGGLRYLAQLRFGLVRESLVERELLLRHVAPHLVRPVPFVLPVKNLWQKLYFGFGLALYQLFAGRTVLPRARYLSRDEMARSAPDLRHNGGGILFWDAQEDDARFVIAVLRTAAGKGAKIVSQIRAERWIEEEGRLTGVAVRDAETGELFTLRARHIASAMGPWTGAISGKSAYPRVRPSKGVHLLLARSAIDMEAGLIAQTENGLLFVIPWEGYWLVGDTDADWAGDAVIPETTEIRELLDRLNATFRQRMTSKDVISVFAGLRPLAATRPGGSSRSVSRSAVIVTRQPGLTEIFGGKYTTYRRMAADLVDHVLVQNRWSAQSSQTASLPLVGAGQVPGSPQPDRAGLVSKYGRCLDEVLKILADDPELAAPVLDSDVIAAEIIHACRHEGALHLDDVIDRRTKLWLWAANRIDLVVEEVAGLMAVELGWDDLRTTEEIRSYRSTWSTAHAALSKS